MHKRIVLSNVYPDDNRGGAAITVAAVQTLRRAFPDSSIALVRVERNGSAEEAFRHTLAQGGLEVLPPPIPPGGGAIGALKAVGRAAAMIIGGIVVENRYVHRKILEADLVVGKGGQLFGRRSKLRGLPGFLLSTYPLVLASRRRNASKSAALGVTVGGYPRYSLGGAVASWVLKQLDLVVVRDAQSYANCVALGVSTKSLLQLPDSVLFLDPPDESLIEEVKDRLDLNQGRFAAITIPFSHRGRAASRAARQFALEIVRKLLKQEIVQWVAVVVQCHGPRSSDLAPSADFAQALNDRRVRLIESDLDPLAMSALYASAEVTLGGRVHSAILSLLAATPAFPLEPPGAHKALDIFRSLGLEDFVLNPGHLGADEAVSRIAGAIAERDQLRIRLRSKTAKLRSKRTMAAEHLRLLVSDRGESRTR